MCYQGELIMDQLIKSIEKECSELCQNLTKVRSTACVDGYIGAFLGSQAMLEAVEVAEKSKKKKQKIIMVIREAIAQLYDTCLAWNHALYKPYGYPGDFSILEVIYNDVPHPDTASSSARQFDLWAQSTILPRAVKARKNALRVFIEEFVSHYSEDNKARILSIASGSAREIRELPRRSVTKTDIVLLDQDKRALSFAKGVLDSKPIDVSVTTLVADALTDISKDSRLRDKGPFDLIYSFGLYDYLSDKLIINNMRAAAQLLSDQGTFVFSLKDKRFYSSWFYDWFFDWRFFERVIADGFRLAEKAGMVVKNTMLVESGAIILYICDKK